MKIVLLQDEIYLPSFAGGIKANRCLMENFASHGHQCLAFTRALTRSTDGPRDCRQFLQEMDSRGIAVNSISPDVYAYQHRGVQVEAINLAGLNARRRYVAGRIEQFSPDCVLVADDKRRWMLAGAVGAAPGRCVPMLQTIMQLPFGPLSVDEDRTQTDLLRSAPLILVISRYMQDYIRSHGEMDADVLAMPVYGRGPFRNLARFDRGFVTMVNPCELKGISIFLSLATTHPEIDFAAVPTWGTSAQDLRQLNALPNVELIDPADNIEDILVRTRVLLVPSLWPETFGYVVPEAMLRGIPVLASDLGGLPEAKLGVDYLLPVKPAERCGESYICPPQETGPWEKALRVLIENKSRYESCSRQSREAALAYVSQISLSHFETRLSQVAAAQ